MEVDADRRVVNNVWTMSQKLETGHHPALLKDSVTTPAGCTIDGILELEEGKLRVTLSRVVLKATQRAGELLFEK
jgi:pyrroline-5-carboxylate reductase